MNDVYRWAARAARTGGGLVLVLSAMAGPVSARPGPPPLPEIDPGSIGSALTLLIGGAFLLIGRTRKS